MSFLNANGNVNSHQKISDQQGNFTGDLNDYYNFGSSVASMGDLDGDGVFDVAVGTIGDDEGGTNKGAVWILLLNEDGTVKSHQKISDQQGDFAGALDNFADFGHSLARIGDLDGDGELENAAGTVADVDDGEFRGAIWILSLGCN